jgi:iron complex transport system ATP-binding protein
MEMTIYGKRLWNVFELRTRLGIVSDRLAELCNTSFKAEEIVISGFFSSIGISFSHTVTDSMLERSKAMMEFMGVYHLADKPMNRLSSGEAKRVLIARALVHDPSTLILDEPASNLDLKTQRTFKESIRSIAKQGRNILLVTHDLANIIPEIDHVIILKEGKLYMQGDKKRLLNQDILSDVYETNVYVDHHDGWYKAWC